MKRSIKLNDMEHKRESKHDGTLKVREMIEMNFRDAAGNKKVDEVGGKSNFQIENVIMKYVKMISLKKTKMIFNI